MSRSRLSFDFKKGSLKCLNCNTEEFFYEVGFYQCPSCLDWFYFCHGCQKYYLVDKFSYQKIICIEDVLLVDAY